jgi:hypothetical protein
MLKPWIVEFVAIFRPSMGNPSSSCHHVPSQGGSGGARKGPVGVEVGDLDGAMASDWSFFFTKCKDLFQQQRRENDGKWVHHWVRLINKIMQFTNKQGEELEWFV